jgi:hypothetical protein
VRGEVGELKAKMESRKWKTEKRHHGKFGRQGAVVEVLQLSLSDSFRMTR